MTTVKTSTLTLRIEPAVKEALRIAAERDHRSIANMVEVLIRDHCRRQGIGIPDIGPPPAGRAGKRSGAGTHRRVRG